jgi:hypothetical protein
VENDDVAAGVDIHSRGLSEDSPFRQLRPPVHDLICGRRLALLSCSSAPRDESAQDASRHSADRHRHPPPRQPL